jgi:hypothetical protein
MQQNIFLWRLNAMVADRGDGPEVLFFLFEESKCLATHNGQK